MAANFYAVAANVTFVSNVTGWVLVGNTFSAEIDIATTVSEVVVGTGEFTAEIDINSAVNVNPVGVGEFDAEIDFVTDLELVYPLSVERANPPNTQWRATPPRNVEQAVAPSTS